MTRKPPPREDEFRFFSEEKARVADTDLNGHVNNSAIAAYCETGRAELVTAVAGAPHERTFGISVARVTIEYLREIKYPARIRVGNAVQRVGNTSVTLEQGLFVAGVCVATSEAVMVMVDRATRRPDPISEAMRARLLDLAPPRE